MLGAEDVRWKKYVRWSCDFLKINAFAQFYLQGHRKFLNTTDAKLMYNTQTLSCFSIDKKFVQNLLNFECRCSVFQESARLRYLNFDDYDFS